MSLVLVSLSLASTPHHVVYDCIAEAGVTCELFEASPEDVAMRLELRHAVRPDESALQAALDIYEQLILDADDTEMECRLRLSAARVASELGLEFTAKTHLKYVAMLGPEPYASEAAKQLR